MNDVFSSVAESIRKRTASVTLGSYLFFWASYHWQGLYVTFFVDQSLIRESQHGLLKNEYVNKYFFGIKSWHDWGFYLGIIIPAILTYIFIRWLPYILLEMYKWEQWFKVEKRIIKIEQEKRIQEDKKALAQETTKAIEEATKTAQAQKKAEKLDPRIIWDNEFSSFDNKRLGLFEQVLRAVYEYNGRIYVSGQYSDMRPEFELDPNALRLADSLNLIEIVEQGQRVELTEKGKYFASKYEGDL